MKAVPHRIVRINYLIRTAAFIYCFLVIGVHGWERSFGTAFWALLAVQFLVYPHLAYLRARLSGHSKAAELSNLYVDSTLLGAWIGALEIGRAHV